MSCIEGVADSAFEDSRTAARCGPSALRQRTPSCPVSGSAAREPAHSASALPLQPGQNDQSCSRAPAPWQTLPARAAYGREWRRRGRRPWSASVVGVGLVSVPGGDQLQRVADASVMHRQLDCRPTRMFQCH